jgi:RNA polymerase sigma-70 factor, ECF subfamily
LPETLPDETLLQRAKDGEELAFRLLYERHRDAVFRFACRMLGSVDAAEDVAQACFVALLSRPTGFDPARASLRTYLCAAARNLSLKRLRDESREAGEDEAPEGLVEIEPLQLLLGKELADQVQAAVTALPALQRELVILVEYEGCALAEAATIVGAAIGTVKSRLHRARESLRRQLAPLRRSAAAMGMGAIDE